MVKCALWYLEVCPPVCWLTLLWIHTGMIVQLMLFKRSIFITLCNVPTVLNTCIAHSDRTWAFSSFAVIILRTPNGIRTSFYPISTHQEWRELRLLKTGLQQGMFVWRVPFKMLMCFLHYISQILPPYQHTVSRPFIIPDTQWTCLKSPNWIAPIWSNS